MLPVRRPPAQSRRSIPITTNKARAKPRSRAGRLDSEYVALAKRDELDALRAEVAILRSSGARVDERVGVRPAMTLLERFNHIKREIGIDEYRLHGDRTLAASQQQGSSGESARHGC